jgi:hypothetical protein
MRLAQGPAEAESRHKTQYRKETPPASFGGHCLKLLPISASSDNSGKDDESVTLLEFVRDRLEPCGISS